LGSGGIVSRILNLATRWRKELRYPKGRSLGGPRSRSDSHGMNSHIAIRIKQTTATASPVSALSISVNDRKSSFTSGIRVLSVSAILRLKDQIFS